MLLAGKRVRNWCNLVSLSRKLQAAVHLRLVHLIKFSENENVIVFVANLKFESFLQNRVL